MAEAAAAAAAAAALAVAIATLTVGPGEQRWGNEDMEPESSLGKHEGRGTSWPCPLLFRSRSCCDFSFLVLFFSKKTLCGSSVS